MTSFEPNEINAVEVDNVRFETVVSARVLTIPEVKRGVFTSIQLGIRITNNTQTPFYFSSNVYSMFPEMIAPNGQVMVSCCAYNLQYNREEYNFIYSVICLPKAF